MKRSCFFTAALFSPLLCWGTLHLPWLETYLQPEVRASFRYLAYEHSSNNYFFDASASLTATPTFSVELEAELAKTSRQTWGVDHLKATGRYVLWDDIAGDPLSVTLGLSLIQAFQPSLRDISSFHHGISEAELFLSFGKETAQGEEWVRRWWGFGAIGIASRGFPWYRGRLSYEWRIRQLFELAIFADGLKGAGFKKLHRHHFKGYGAIDHRSVDLGLRLTYLIPFFGSFYVEYAYRPYAQNFPKRANIVTAQLHYLY